MAKLLPVSPAVAISLVVAFLSGGLAGAIFNWFVNRSEPTVLTYSLNRTPLAAPEASVLIPDLRIQVGKKTIQELYAYSIEFDSPQGPRVDRVQIGIFFPRKVTVYGKSTESPSGLHSINCDQLDNGFRCQMSPISRSSGRGYRVVVATDEKEAPSVQTVARDVDLMTTAEFVARKSRVWESLFSPKVLGQVGLGALLIGLLIALLVLQRRLLGRMVRPIVVGKVTDSEGRPIKGADVEVVLESPEHTFAPVQTDRFGDFILGHLSKVSLLTGRVRITHPDYLTSDRQIDSPIVYERLQCSSKKSQGE